jgi:phosphomannomutase/phosphoglucomutase
MDLKAKFQELTDGSSDRHVDPKFSYLLGLLGLVLLVAATWLYFSDANSQRAMERAAAEGGEAAGLLMEPVQAFRAVLEDSRIQERALQVLAGEATEEDLLADARGRLPAIDRVRVFPADRLETLTPETLGPNGYALLDLALSLLDGKQAQMQVHGILEPPRVFDGVRIDAEGEAVAVLLFGVDAAYLIDAFTPGNSGIGAIRLAQYNGRQPATVLKQLGDPADLGDVPERAVVPGTMFRVEFPRVQPIAAVGAGMLLSVIIIGLLCLALALVMYRRSQAHAAAATGSERRAIEVAGDAMPEPAEGADASFEDAVTETQPLRAPEPEPEPEPEPPAAAVPPPMHLPYDIAKRRLQQEAEHTPVDLDPGIFRAYDIRGVIDKTLDSGIAYQIGQAVGSAVMERKAGPVVVARDGRLSGPYLMKGIIEGLVATGCDVIDIGAAPTGVLYYAAHEYANGSAIVITGSHNPPDYNGFKIMVGGDTLHGDAIKALYERIVDNDLKTGQGKVERRNVIKNYILRIAEDIKVEKPLRVVLDCGNGIGGACAPDVLRAIGVDVLPLYDEVDGTFPNHHPDPSEPENLQDLIDSVRLMDADLGLALDGDADRLGVVTLAGKIIYPDRVMMLLALDVLDRVPGATILYDVKCTGHLPKVIREAGGNPVMYKTGHSLMKAKMKEVGSPFSGEMSGHFFFGERWYGVDDGIYAAARLLEILGSTDTPPEAILNALPSSYSTPELKVEMEEGKNHAFVEAFKEAVAGQTGVGSAFEGAEINTIDGLRADFEDGWGLVRPSNTTPVLVVRFDAETEEALERIKSTFRRQMLDLNPDLNLPF